MQEIATHSAGELRYFDLGEQFYVISLPTYFQIRVFWLNPYQVTSFYLCNDN